MNFKATADSFMFQCYGWDWEKNLTQLTLRLVQRVATEFHYIWQAVYVSGQDYLTHIVDSTEYGGCL